MENQQQQQQGNDTIMPAILSKDSGHSNRIAAVNEEEKSRTCNRPGHHDNPGNLQKPRWQKFLAYVGPGFLISLAYLDPGNLETDLQAGASYQYELLWVILIGLVFSLIIQSLAANLGVCTGQHLSEHCKAEYPKYVKYCLWLLAESSVIAADVPEVIGTAFALNLLFHIPVWAGVICTGFSTLLFLGLQRYGVRKLELFIATLVFILAACYFAELSYVKPPAADVMKGLFVPKLSGQGAVGNTIALLGALVMPHNLFLHSALVLSRKVPPTVRGINDACRYFLMETGFALFIALLINIAVTSVTGAICSADNLSAQQADQCNNLTLDSASFLLKNVLGKSSSIVYAIALLASGQSSAITGTYAGQFIMQGFLDLKMRPWLRNLVTRLIAITPSLVAAIIGGPAAAGALIIISSMILSFELPFVLIPLLKFSGSTTKMGPHKNSIFIIVFSWILGLLIIGINVYYLSTGFVGWLIHNKLPKIGNAFIGLAVFPIMAIYVLAVIYLAFRKDVVASYIEPKDGINLENGQGKDNNNEDLEKDHLPYREDLADIPLPE